MRRASRPFAILVSLLAIVVVGLVADRFVNGPQLAPRPPATGPAGSSPVASAVPSERPTFPSTIEPDATLGGADLRPCTADDLAIWAWGWDGATGSLAGGATVIDVTPEPCHVAGQPAVALFANRHTSIATGEPSQRDQTGEVVDLSEGDFAEITTVWRNWCGTPPPRPLSIRLTLPDSGGDLEAIVHERAGSRTAVPRCDAQGVPSTIGVAKAFEAPGAYEPDVAAAACRVDDLAGYLGPWGAGLGNYYASAFVLNTGGLDCLLPITPPLELRDAERKRLASAEQRNPNPSIVLPAGWVAVARIDFANWCATQPKLPFKFELTIGSAPLALAPATENSEIGPPSCISPGETPPPVLGYESAFAVPGLSEP